MGDSPVDAGPASAIQSYLRNLTTNRNQLFIQRVVRSFPALCHLKSAVNLPAREQPSCLRLCQGGLCHKALHANVKLVFSFSLRAKNINDHARWRTAPAIRPAHVRPQQHVCMLYVPPQQQHIGVLREQHPAARYPCHVSTPAPGLRLLAKRGAPGGSDLGQIHQSLVTTHSRGGLSFKGLGVYVNSTLLYSAQNASRCWLSGSSDSSCSRRVWKAGSCVGGASSAGAARKNAR